MIHGIPNYGQTCYVNSVLQALASLDSFILYLEQLSDEQSGLETQVQVQVQPPNCNITSVRNKLDNKLDDTNTNTNTNTNTATATATATYIDKNCPNNNIHDDDDDDVDNNTILKKAPDTSTDNDNSDFTNPILSTTNKKTQQQQQLPAKILLDLLYKVNGTIGTSTSTSTTGTINRRHPLSTCTTSSASGTSRTVTNTGSSSTNTTSTGSKKSTTETITDNTTSTDACTSNTDNVSVQTLLLEDNNLKQQIQRVQVQSMSNSIKAQQQQQQQQQQSSLQPNNDTSTSTDIHNKQYPTTIVNPIITSSTCTTSTFTSTSTTGSSTSDTGTAATTSTSTTSKTALSISNNVLLFQTVQWLYINVYKSILLSVSKNKPPLLLTNSSDPFITILKWNELLLSTTKRQVQRLIVNIGSTINKVYIYNTNSIIDTRPLIRLVGTVHDQFRYNIFFQRNVGTTTSNQQQQDAEEFLQSLLDILPVVFPNSNTHIDCNNDTLVPPVSESISSTSVSSSSVSSSSVSPSVPTTTTTTTTATTPTNPFCGWIGNTIQCCTCLHTRRIRPLSFVDIPVVPTEVVQLSSSQAMYSSNSNNDNTVPMNMSSTNKRQSFFHQVPSSCTIDECLYDFIKLESISDVHCRNCTIQTQKQHYQDEIWMLQGAIHAARKNNKNNNHTTERVQQQLNNTNTTNQFDTLQSDYDRVVKIVNTLNQMSPDDDDDDKPLLIPLSIEENLYSSISSIQSTSSSINILDKKEHQQDKRVPLEKHTANKSLPIVQLPKILTLHIQRRYYDPISQSMIKSCQHVIFNEYWNVTPYCYAATNISTTSIVNSKSNKSTNTNTNTNTNTTTTTTATTTATTPSVKLYRLMSVIEHQGNASFGHYVCYRRNSNNNNLNSITTTTTKQNSSPIPSLRLNGSNSWLRISDETVQQCSWLTVSRCQAYLLFYEQV